MRAVLGMDAAWTTKQPSGVALIVRGKSQWSLIEAATSYNAFGGGPDVENARPHGSEADVDGLIDQATRLAGGSPDLVAVDMPLAANGVVERRRLADDQVSAEFGGRGCSTHSPSPERPGRVARDLLNGLIRAGYPLATSRVEPPATIEVYPHPALLTLTGQAYRLPYKIGKIRSYWREEEQAKRRLNLLDTWRKIVVALEAEIDGVSARLVLPDAASPVWFMKAFEDKLDAVVCAWAGACAVEGRARAFGDATAAIWVPEGLLASQR